MKTKRILLPVFLGVLLCGALAAFFRLSGGQVTAGTIGGIPTPDGFIREAADSGSYAEYLRSIPLKEAGSRVHLYGGKEAPFQWLSAGVVDRRLIDKYEQCADVTIRIRADYFWETKQLSGLRFTDIRGVEHVYDKRGDARWLYVDYLKALYRSCNTASVYKETSPREIRDVQPGDVLVYTSRRKGSYGHAVLVADVARDETGRVAILCVEGNTPAREIHIIRNLNPFHNPWFILDGSERMIRLSVSRFRREELRHY